VARSKASGSTLPAVLQPSLWSDELCDAIHHLAGVFCDLHSIRGGDDTEQVNVEFIHSKVRQLQDLEHQFLALGSDTTLVMDIRASMRRLNDLLKLQKARDRGASNAAESSVGVQAGHGRSQPSDKSSDQCESDSGYESAATQILVEPPRPAPPRLHGPAVSDSNDDNEPRRLRPPTLRTSSPCLVKQPSFRPGDDGCWKERLLDRRGTFAITKGKESPTRAMFNIYV